MRKWTYLVAALLMGGVSTSLTSCIDNDEPAGINDLRGAKAEFIRAKADYEAALTAYQMIENQIKEQELARETILTQMKELELEVAQAQTEYDVARINAQKELLIEEYNTKLANQKAWTAQAEAELIKALNALEIIELNDRNDKFTAQIKNIRTALTGTNGALEELREAQEDLLDAKKEVMDYVSQSKYFKTKKALKKSIHENDLTILEGLLKDYQSITAADEKALQEKVEALKEKILALDQKELDEWQKLQDMKKSDAFLKISDAIKDLELTQKKDTAFVVKKVDAAIADGFHTAVSNVSAWTSPDFEIGDFFKEAAPGEYEMTADLVSKTEELQNLSVNDLQTAVQNQYQGQYAADYNNLFNTSKSATDLFDAATGKVKASIAANVAAEKNRLEKIDAPNIKKSFEETVKAWIEAKLAIDEYLLKNNKDRVNDKGFDAIAQAVKDYNDPDVTKNQDAKAAKALRDKLFAYIETRNAIDDGAENMESVLATYEADKTSDPLDDAATLASFNSLIAGGTNSLNIYATLQWGYTPTNWGEYEGTSIIKKYYEADHTLFGTSGYNELSEGQTPILGADNKIPENLADAVAEDLTSTNGLYKEYMASIDFAGEYPYITNIDKWTALNDDLTKQGEEIAARQKELQDGIDAVVAQHEEELVKVYEQELAVYLIKGSTMIDGENVISGNNPVSDYITTTPGSTPSTGIIMYEDRTELAALQEEMEFIKEAIKNDCKFVYIEYDKVNDKYVTKTSNDLTGLIETTQQEIIKLQEKIEKVQLEIDKFDQLGFFNGQYREILEANVTDAQKDVEIAQTIVDNYNKTLKAMLEAYDPEDSSTPETPEEGGEETPAE